MKYVWVHKVKLICIGVKHGSKANEHKKMTWHIYQSREHTCHISFTITHISHITQCMKVNMNAWSITHKRSSPSHKLPLNLTYSLPLALWHQAPKARDGRRGRSRRVGRWGAMRDLKMSCIILGPWTLSGRTLCHWKWRWSGLGLLGGLDSWHYTTHQN